MHLPRLLPGLSLLTFLAACGGGDSGSGDAIKVAVVLPLTGATAETAEQMRNAANLALEEINADGGVDGKKLELGFYDDELTPEGATREAQPL